MIEARAKPNATGSKLAYSKLKTLLKKNPEYVNELKDLENEMEILFRRPTTDFGDAITGTNTEA